MEIKDDKIYLLTNYHIQEKCIKQYENINIKKELGKGNFGTVYEICKNKDDCKYVMKIIPLEVYIPSDRCVLDEPDTHESCLIYSVDDFNKEVKNTLIASNLNIGPKLYSSWICDNVKSPLHYKILKKILKWDLY